MPGELTGLSSDAGPTPQLCPGRVAASQGPASAASRHVEPLAPARYKVQFTASVELRDKLERLQALMRSAVPDGDLAQVIGVGVSQGPIATPTPAN